MEAKKLQQVRIEDFDVAALRKAAREGRLYLQPARQTDDEVRSIVLTMVSRLDKCVTPQYAPCLGRMWQALLAEPRLWHFFCMQRTRNPSNRVNYHALNALVFHLWACHVYRAESAVELHLLLEQAKKRNSHYTGSSQYGFTKAERKLIAEILEKVK